MFWVELSCFNYIINIVKYELNGLFFFVKNFGLFFLVYCDFIKWEEGKIFSMLFLVNKIILDFVILVEVFICVLY